MKNKDERFKVIHKEGSELNYKGVVRILVDKITGVHYLSRYNVGLTPLLDETGKPIIDKSVLYD